MFSSRRAQRTVDPAFDPMSKTPDDKWVGEDPMDEIVRLVEADLAERTRPGILDHDHLAAVIAAELGTHHDPMDPVDVTGKGPAAAAANYDLWDDKALAELPDDFTFDELEPRRISEGVLPVHPEQDRGPRLARIGLIAAVAVGALVAGGGAVWWAFSGSSGGFGEPQLVRAPDGPYKIVPDAGDTIDEPVEGQAIFNQVDGVPPKGEERLVTREETVPELPPVNPQVSRVILPDGQEVASQDAVAPVESGPRRVRTVLVKPDGTIIENPETPALRRPTDLAPAPGTLDALAAEAAGTPPASLEPIAEPPEPEVAALQPAPTAVAPEPEPEPVAPPEPVAEAPEPVAPVAVAPPANDESSSAGLPPLPEAEQTAPEPVAPPPPADEPLRPAATLAPAAEPATVEPPPAPVAVAPEPVTVPVEPAPAAAAVAPVTVPAEEAAPLLPPAPAEAAAPAPTPRIKPAAPRAPAPAAAANDGPIDLAAAAAAPAPEKPAQQVAAVEPAAAAAPAPAGSAFVQVSSQRSEDAALAAFKKMQAKYPNLLAGVSPDVQRADLGAKGIYYRVRVPQPSRSEAISLCEALKSAGADCLIAKK